MEIIDTHCHVHFENYDQDRDEVLKRSAEAGVKRIICVGCSLADSQAAIDFARNHSGVWATAGAHPNDGADFLTDPDAASKLKEMLGQPKVVAVGEIGLDYYRDFTPKADQERTLRKQIEIGLDSGLPFVFHVRDAWDDFWQVVDSYEGVKGVIHCFSSGPKRLKQALERDFYVALNGITTYTKDSGLLEAAKQVPLSKLMLETDAPFLTPVPHRGERCEPMHTADTWHFLADLRGESASDIAAASTANAAGLFSLNEERIS